MQSFSNKKIILTGSTGYIGSAFLKLLKKNNIFYTTLGRNKIVNKYHKYFIFDDMNLPDNLLDNYDYLIHFASLSHTNITNEEIVKKNILDPSIYLAKKALKSKLKKFIYISSVKAIKNENNKIDNTTDLYGYYKYLTENKLIEIFNNSSTNLIIIRPALVYGGYNIKGNLNILNKYISKSPIVILPKIINKRSMIHIDNLIHGIYQITFSNTNHEKTFNLTDNKTYSFIDICNAINLKYKRNIIFVNFPNFIIKLIIKFETLFGKNLINKIFADEIYKKTNIEKYSCLQNKDICNFYDTTF